MTAINSFPLYPVPLTQDIGNTRKTALKRSPDKTLFAQTLNGQFREAPVTLTKHAQERLTERNICLSTAEWNQIRDKLQEAEKMGVNESLVLTKDAALVVNAPKNTVITAMNLQEAQSHIFTNINGTIVIGH